jgi:regulator of cell morphogenesis and NO signaling
MQHVACMQTIQMSLGDIATSNPVATRVFLRHKLDFCCGGRRSLVEACRSAGLDPDAIIAELDEESARGSESARWDRRPQSELADHIESRYHATLRRDVPPLVDAARKVERVHAQKPAVPAGLADLLAAFLADMQQHMEKEEKVLFPMIRRAAPSEALAMPIGVMKREHDTHGEYLARIRALTGDLRAPAHACATWRALYDGLATIEADLMEHVHLENNILFARAVAG